MNQTLPDLLQQQSSNVEKLEQLLMDEKTALETRDTPSLEAVSIEKQVLITTIAEIDSQINQHQDAQLIETQFAEEKQQLETQLQHCQELNDVNGKIIELNLRNSKRLTDTIIRSRSQNNVTYDKSGRTRGSVSTLGMKFRS